LVNGREKDGIRHIIRYLIRHNPHSFQSENKVINKYPKKTITESENLF